MPLKPLSVLSQYLTPQKTLTRMAGAGASNLHQTALTQAVIRWFVRRYGVDMSEAAEPDLARYASFNDFFTRALRPGARPLADADWICPVDGRISQFGAIEGDQIFQAKGHRYSTQALLGGDAGLAAQFKNGHFATLYLSPRDYHRIHMPTRGRIRQMVYVPGDLFSVNPTTAQYVPGLFARNERLVCVFEGEDARPFVLVLVGAMIVGSMATVWSGTVNAKRPAKIQKWNYPNHQTTSSPVYLEKGAEMGRFLLGSTVVVLIPPSVLEFNDSWKAGGSLKMGEIMANVRRDALI
jgi:phosphatidylserine decarboxylase